MNRLFISCRSSDGKQETDRPNADLDRLCGGGSWRKAIGAALGKRPKVFLITRDGMDDRDPTGARRTNQPGDLIRNALLAAHARDATIVRQRTEDWPHGLQRLLDTGNLSLEPNASGNAFAGQFWRTGDQASVPVLLQRGP